MLAFSKSSVLYKNLDLQLPKGYDIPMVKGLFHIGLKPFTINIGAVRRTKIHQDDSAAILLNDRMQTRNAPGIGLIRREVDIRHDRLSFTDASEREFIAG